MATLGLDADQFTLIIFILQMTLTTTAVLASPLDEPPSSCSCCIHPSNSTVVYGEWLNLTFVVQPCNITDVHWYTTGYTRSLDNSHLLRDVQADIDISFPENVHCQNNIKKFWFNVKITQDTHRILNGAITAFGEFNDNLCYSIPSARYYVANPKVCGDTYIGPTPTIPDSDDYGDIASSLGVYGSMTTESSSVSILVETRWTLAIAITAVSLILIL